MSVVVGVVALIDIGMGHIIEFQILRKHKRRFGKSAFVAQRLNFGYGFLETVKVGYEKSRGVDVSPLWEAKAAGCG